MRFSYTTPERVRHSIVRLLSLVIGGASLVLTVASCLLRTTITEPLISLPKSSRIPRDCSVLHQVGRNRLSASPWWSFAPMC
jgi:hypothetical protein